MIRIALADDHKIIRDGVRAMIGQEPNFEVVAEAGNGSELLEVLSRVPVDVAIVDINMPGMDGYEATQRIVAQYPDIRVIILSMLDNEGYITKMMEAGAKGYLLKTTGKDEFIYAIQRVATGSQYICMEIAINLLKKMNTHSVRMNNFNDKNSSDLSKREIEVLQLIAEGFTNAEIADKLFTSKRTIESHRQRLLDKTNSNNTATLIKYALSNGLIQ